MLLAMWLRLRAMRRKVILAIHSSRWATRQGMRHRAIPLAIRNNRWAIRRAMHRRVIPPAMRLRAIHNLIQGSPILANLIQGSRTLVSLIRGSRTQGNP